jgi:hypothetical protein
MRLYPSGGSAPVETSSRAEMSSRRAQTKQQARPREQFPAGVEAEFPAC